MFMPRRNYQTILSHNARWYKQSVNYVKNEVRNIIQNIAASIIDFDTIYKIMFHPDFTVNLAEHMFKHDQNYDSTQIDILQRYNCEYYRGIITHG